MLQLPYEVVVFFLLHCQDQKMWLVVVPPNDYATREKIFVKMAGR
jgi:hypothetical protein